MSSYRVWTELDSTNPLLQSKRVNTLRIINRSILLNNPLDFRPVAREVSTRVESQVTKALHNDSLVVDARNQPYYLHEVCVIQEVGGCEVKTFTSTAFSTVYTS